MDLTNKEYDQMIKTYAQKSKVVRNTALAFLIGGLICTIGEVISNLIQSLNIFSKEEVSSCVSITMIFLGALLTGLKVYDNIAKVAGAGTLVPITGFANSIVSPAMEFKSEGFILGMGAKMFIIAGPVLVYGTTASIIYGAVLYIIKLIWR